MTFRPALVGLIILTAWGWSAAYSQTVRRLPENSANVAIRKTYRMGKLRLPQTPGSPAATFVLEESLFGPWHLVVPGDDVELAALVNRPVVLRGWFETLRDGRTTVFVVDRAYAAAEPSWRMWGTGLAGAPAMSVIAAPSDSLPAHARTNTEVADEGAENPVRSSRRRTGDRAETRPGSVQHASWDSAEDDNDEDDQPVLPGKVRHAQAQQEESLPPPRRSASGNGSEPALELRSRPRDTYYWADPPYATTETDPYGLGSLGNCPACGGPMATGMHAGCNSPERFWLHGDYLHWWTRALELPPLVTTSPAGTPQANAGVLGLPTTTVLFGNSEVNDTDHAGWRASGGAWIGPAKRWGVELDYFRLDDQQEGFAQSSNGSVILARPYFDIVAGNEAALLVAFPGVASGSVSAEAITKLDAAGGRIRWNLCCRSDPSAFSGYPMAASGYRVDLTGGYRFARLSDHLNVRHTSVDLATDDTVFAEDLFVSGNEFHGGEVGIVWERRLGRWMLLGVGRIAFGNNRQTARIEGRSVIDTGTGPQTFTGGVLAQSSNIGFFRRDEFSIIPEVGMTLGFRLTNHTQLTVGYTFYYFSNVLRAGDFVDRDLNPGLLPPPSGPLTGPARPQFVVHETDFWAQGLTAGVDVRF